MGAGAVSGGTSKLCSLRESGETGEGDIGPAPTLGAGGVSGRRPGGERRQGRSVEPGCGEEPWNSRRGRRGAGSGRGGQGKGRDRALPFSEPSLA